MAIAEQDLQALHDEAACARLCSAFVTHIDAQAYAPLLELFTEDATFDRMGTVIVGREAIGRFLQARPAGVVTRHLSTGFHLQLEPPDAAAGRSVVLFCQGAAPAGGGPAAMTAPPSVVEYHDRYRRTAAGWRIGERRIRMALQGQPPGA